jgi:hypothetical protein
VTAFQFSLPPGTGLWVTGAAGREIVEVFWKARIQAVRVGLCYEEKRVRGFIWQGGRKRWGGAWGVVEMGLEGTQNTQLCFSWPLLTSHTSTSSTP